MANYKRNAFVGGAWAKKSELYDRKVKRAKIVSETNPETSAYKDDDGNAQQQDVCKVMFEGEKEALKVTLNRATINGLVDAFGEDSKLWQGQYLAVEIEKQPGKKYPLYLIPDGYERVENSAGYSEIVKKGAKPEAAPQEDERNLEALPF